MVLAKSFRLQNWGQSKLLKQMNSACWLQYRGFVLKKFTELVFVSCNMWNFFHFLRWKTFVLPILTCVTNRFALWKLSILLHLWKKNICKLFEITNSYKPKIVLNSKCHLSIIGDVNNMKINTGQILFVDSLKSGLNESFAVHRDEKIEIFVRRVRASRSSHEQEISHQLKLLGSDINDLCVHLG